MTSFFTALLDVLLSIVAIVLIATFAAESATRPTK